ncbi:glycosyltransferase [Lederbergia sp. NSJ-179]|uniref:CgeB family protein n=1 Tax=Lederbergia sp. NSJ-179 TaxID=2931402 RepID=UPI001FD588F5|nr:glycosyltransferase [Lederbergia sp. NSJ-179]MCJ7841373.1 glycosyltransferase [Lederbergia sp. NSJ-179]
MKILYISSGYPMIYHYLDRNIERALHYASQKCILFQPHESIDQLESILNEEEAPQFSLTLLGDHLSKQARNLLSDYHMKQAVWLTEDPFYIDQTIQRIFDDDYVFTIDSGAQKEYLSAGFSHVYHLPLGTDPTTFARMQVDNRYQSDVLLVGYPYPSRVQLVEFLLRNGSFPITVIGKQWYNRLAKKYRKHVNITLYDQWLEPEEIAKFYNGAKIVLNPHRHSGFSFQQNRRNIRNETINNRTFDIAACGAFQLIEELPDLRLFFSEDEMISYQDHRDCLEKIYFYLTREQIRRRVGVQVQKKVYNKHTFQHRIETIMDIMVNE